MGIIKKLTNSVSNLARSSIRIVKASLKIIAQLFWRGITELLLEIFLFGVGLALAFLFYSLGISASLALVLSLMIVISIIILAIRFFSSHKSKLINTRTKFRGEEKLADWIAQTLAQKAPQEWEEYQDWLHDILLARLQLLDRGFPVWKVSIITYGRLIGFCVIVGFMKLIKLVVHLRV